MTPSWRLASPQRAWLLLVAATLAAFWVRQEGLGGVAAGTATLAIAYVKARLVVLDFMGLRHAPLLWRSLLEGWLLLVTGALIAIYAGGWK